MWPDVCRGRIAELTMKGEWKLLSSLSALFLTCWLGLIDHAVIYFLGSRRSGSVSKVQYLCNNKIFSRFSSTMNTFRSSIIHMHMSCRLFCKKLIFILQETHLLYCRFAETFAKKPETIVGQSAALDEFPH